MPTMKQRLQTNEATVDSRLMLRRASGAEVLAVGFLFLVFSTNTLFLGATARSQMQRRSAVVSI
jgi:hypothetical protein